jgi:putative redox protein
VSTTAESGAVLVQETGDGQFAQVIHAGQHMLHAGEPRMFGGDDSGPSPYDLLLASLGACTSMTIRSYADRKKIPLEKVTVRLKHEKIHALDCAESANRECRIDKIECQIELVGRLDDAQRRRLLEMAGKCPVHRTLNSEVRISTSLKL